jgi:hypothetical protein
MPPTAEISVLDTPARLHRILVHHVAHNDGILPLDKGGMDVLSPENFRELIIYSKQHHIIDTPFAGVCVRGW